MNDVMELQKLLLILFLHGRIIVFPAVVDMKNDSHQSNFPKFRQTHTQTHTGTQTHTHDVSLAF